MNKIKVLEVNNIDLLGRRFNGYDMIQDISDETIEVKQAVIHKMSSNDKVVKILKNKNQEIIHAIFDGIEKENSIHNIYSITTPALFKLPEYQEADIIHFHMFHNTKLSLFSLIKIAKEKKVVISLHDPWFLTGRCVHFLSCDNWQTGCQNCPDLHSLFPFDKDNCSELWNLKKYIFDNIDIDLVLPSNWMLNLIKKSPIFENQKNYFKIPFGIDVNKFAKISYESARKELDIKSNEIVLFFRAQNEFKGTPYIIEALKELETDRKITLLTCDNKGLISELENKYRIIELGKINDDKMIVAMNSCDIFLMPSIGESFGMMAIEAMACAKPIIVFNNSALPSVTHAPECGYLVNDRDSKDLMKAIAELVNNKKERQRRGTLAKQIAIEEYQLEKYNQNIKDMYVKVMERTHKDIKRQPPEKDLVNENNFKDYLNKLSIRIFSKDKELIKKLTYDVDKSYLDKKKKINYEDINIQEILEEYLIKLEDTTTKTSKIKARNLIQRFMFFLLYDREILIEKVLNRLKKKD